ncbi:MOG interacting and ectopic P-granules protein 1 isoform X2 [Coccinella septempunctata]|uniref:MOG interacting and ectopic P-granules protein 1 isoform X2 n=1 Tax=Coccinella septempunctata TaxID=41139 RepID=UPI001D083113|nr:MOG interacting and ectopic P-granules protein 1 isoform X2 [Coccinella septempunctata]
MAAIANMGEVEDMQSKEEGATVNGDTSDTEMNSVECDDINKDVAGNSDEKMEIEESENSVDESKSSDEIQVPNDTNEGSNLNNGDSNADSNMEVREESNITDETTEDDQISSNMDETSADKLCDDVNMEKNCENSKDEDENEEDDEDEAKVEDNDSQSQDSEDEVIESTQNTSSPKDSGDEEDIHEIEDDDDVIHVESKEAASDNEDVEETIELNDSGAEEGEVMIVDNPRRSPKQNGTSRQDETEIIELTTPEKKIPEDESITPRRSSRNINRQKSYVEEEKEEEESKRVLAAEQSSEESDIEEILPEDPLANIGDAIQIERIPSKRKILPKTSDSSAIVVKDTKRLVEIASKSTPTTSGKKEPTLVIIDTNSILSGKGPIPINKSLNIPSQTTGYSSVLPLALPAQGMYPPNMRATITPIPMVNQNQTVIKPSTSQPNTPVLPTLTDDMFVVEAPSFIVPYVYEKPPVENLKEFLVNYKKEVQKELEKEKTDNKSEKGEAEDEKEELDETEEKKVSEKQVEKKNDDDKPYNYFTSPLGKFFSEIGIGLVQEFVQTDLLKQQKRKRDRERSRNPETLKTIQSLSKNLEFTKENNEPYKLAFKKCEFCSFKTESLLAMSYHLETPHVKNYIYKCNFCAHETRSPHDILYHMEAEHMVRGRLERALSFHQCPNCPFEENQKGKLSRHLMACSRKYKPERNLEPPLDWEPPAKIPRVPKMRPGMNVSAYQALSKNSPQQQQQFQLLNKMQLQNNSQMSRGRGRASMPQLKGAQLIRQGNLPGMVYKPTMSGGSVLVPTSYQLSGNQVVGGQDLNGRLGPNSHMLLPATSSLAQQQQSPKAKSVNTPSISITPLPRTTAPSPRASTSSGSQNAPASQQAKPGDTNSKNSFVICEICDGYIKDLEQLRNHMHWIHKVKIHPKMIYNRPPLNCQKCQFRFFTDQGLERHLLGSHGLVTSSMQEAANRSKDAGRCPVCGRVYQWKLLNHVARDHNMTLKPAHLSYKCTVCTATFGMYKQFENHVYSAHSVVAKRVMDKKGSSSSKSSSTEQALKPLKINDEITIIPQPAKAASGKEETGSNKNT